MRTREIPFQDWEGFFDCFNRQHEGWRATVATLGGDVAGLGVEARQMPLTGVTLDIKDGSRSIVIILENRDSGHLTHIIAAPKHVRVRETEEGAQEALIIESANGTITLLRFRATMLPEMLDDVVS
jgi:hypothetical protein